MDIRELVMRRVGPLPVWAWTLIVAITVGGLMMIQRTKNGVAGQPPGAGTGPGGSNGEFQSSTSSTTTDENGNTTTTQYSASGASPFGIPGYLTQAAYPMPYSLGDIYNNQTVTIPQNPTQVIIPPAPTPPPPPPPPQIITKPDGQGIPAPQPPRQETWTVDPGNSLWYIAKVTLQRRWGRAPTNAEIAGYWPQIYDRNRGVIGGNPNLIHPGQVFVLP